MPRGGRSRGIAAICRPICTLAVERKITVISWSALGRSRAHGGCGTIDLLRWVAAVPDRMARPAGASFCSGGRAMSETAERLKSELAMLPPQERAELARYLIHSLDTGEAEDVE